MIKEYRKKHGLKQVELAKILGVAQSSISYAENHGSKQIEQRLSDYMRRERAVERYKYVLNMTGDACPKIKYPERISVVQMTKKSVFWRIIDGIKRIF